MSAPMHISVGAMDGHTQILFYSLCFGPFLVLMAVAIREHRRQSREDPLKIWMSHDTDRYLAPELRRGAAAGSSAPPQARDEHEPDETGS